MTYEMYMSTNMYRDMFYLVLNLAIALFLTILVIYFLILAIKALKKYLNSSNETNEFKLEIENLKQEIDLLKNKNQSIEFKVVTEKLKQEVSILKTKVEALEKEN